MHLLVNSKNLYQGTNQSGVQCTKYPDTNETGSRKNYPPKTRLAN